MGRYICYDLSTDVGNTLEQCNEGQSMCGGWGSARTHRQGIDILVYTCLILSRFKMSKYLCFRPCCVSTLERRKGPKTRRIKHNQEWLFVKPLPFQMGTKTWDIDGSPSVKNRAGVNPITMDCKMNECYSDPQKSLHCNAVHWSNELFA